MAALGKDDLIIQLIRSWEPSPPRWEFTKRPLHIRSDQIGANFEGNTTHGRVSRWASATWRNGSFVQVYLFFGSPQPTVSDIARAQHELDGTRFPDWIVRG